MITVSKYKTLLFVTSALLVTSCSDFLDQKGDTDYSASEVYESTSQTELRVNNLYGALTSDRTYAQDLAVTFCNNTDIECVDGMYSNKDGRRDNLATYRGWGNYYNSSLLADSKNYDMYNELFGITESANLTINGILDSKLYQSGSDEDKATMGAYLGEALTLRAVAFRDLIRLYGDVPANFSPTKDDLSNGYLPKTNRDVILDSLISDLTNAAELLPWVGENGYTAEHVTKGFALGLKAQLALMRAGWAIREGDMNTIYNGQFAGQYESEANADANFPTQRPVQSIRDKYYKIAAEACAEVINGKKHNLATSFAEYWKNVDSLVIDPSYESLFEIPFGLNKSGELGYSVGIRLEYQTGYENGVVQPDGYGYTNSTGHMSLTAKLLYDYESQDTRRNVTCGSISIRSTAGSNNAKHGRRLDQYIGNKPFGVPCGKWDPRKMSEQWRQVNLNASGKFGYGINYVMMRYSQVLLMYAEAVNEMENDGVAYAGPMTKNAALNTIRQRAGVSDVTTTDYTDFFTAIVNEDELEFAGEGVRKYDLVRWNLLCSKIKETRTITLNREQTNTAGTDVKWDPKVAIWQQSGNANYIDEARISYGKYYTEYAQSDPKQGNSWKTSFGSADTDQDANANYYCGGLVGCPTNTPTVKNRYLLPLANQTVSASGGVLKNSYGY